MRTRLGLKVLGLSALVMGVMAIGTAGSAQAQPGACWGYELSAGHLLCFDANLEAQTAIVFENQTATLLIANVNLEVLCTGAQFIEGGQLAANGSILLGRLQFTGCISLSRTPTLTKLNSCTPKDPVGGSGVIRTEKGDGLLILHKLSDGKVVPMILFLPDTGTTLAKIFLGEECAVSEELIVTGHLDLVECNGTLAQHLVTHLFEESKTLRLMKVGVNTAELDGSFNVSLAGAHNGFKWAGLPA